MDTKSRFKWQLNCLGILAWMMIGMSFIGWFGGSDEKFAKLMAGMSLLFLGVALNSLVIFLKQFLDQVQNIEAKLNALSPENDN